ISMEDRSLNESNRSAFNEIWSFLERGYAQLSFVVAGRGYLAIANHDEPLTEVELLAAKNHANRGLIVTDNSEESFLGYYIDQGNRCADSQPQTWRGAPETLARKAVLAARLHSVRLGDEDWELTMAKVTSSQKKRMAKRAASACGSDFSPELLRAIFD